MREFRSLETCGVQGGIKKGSTFAPMPTEATLGFNFSAGKSLNSDPAT